MLGFAIQILLLGAPTASEELYPPTLEAEPGTPAPPWKRRRRVGVKLMPKGAGLTDLSRWPVEPDAPAEVDAERFAAALTTICGWLPKGRAQRYAEWVLESAEEFDVDPFLLGALIYRQSRCNPVHKDDFGVGLTALNLRMHAPHIESRTYSYYLLDTGAWVPRQLAMPDFAFTRRNLRKARSNIYFAAALLRVARDQCPDVDGVFGSVPHRHYVSHFAWGDRVGGAGAEDRILRARRQLIEYYRPVTLPPLGAFGEIPLHCPLDAPPRKATSAWGADRDGGKRRHRGLDMSASGGEPVRSVAAGTVVFAGLDLRRKPSVPLTPETYQAGLRSYRRLAPGGLFVMVRHGDGLQSAYMHLSSIDVKAGDAVRAGDLLGRVGRTGMKRSAAHLHFELRHEGRHVNPYPHLAPYLFEPTATWRGRRVAIAEKKARRARRLRAWKRRKAREAAKKKKKRRRRKK